MIGRLHGRALEETPDGHVLIDVGGVGYEVVTPAGAVGRAKHDAKGLVSMYIHTNVREDALELFGFPNTDDRQTFRRLISIPKVGPKVALAILSVLSTDELADLVAAEEVMRLTRVPGIGKKTAERILLELKGKLIGGLSPAPRTGGAGAASDGEAGQRAMLQDALERMGFRAVEAERAVKTLKDLSRPTGELVREALKVLAP